MTQLICKKPRYAIRTEGFFSSEKLPLSNQHNNKKKLTNKIIIIIPDCKYLLLLL